jgi:hypothetical protein
MDCSPGHWSSPGTGEVHTRSVGYRGVLIIYLNIVDSEHSVPFEGMV